MISLKEAREQKSLTIEELATASNVTPESIAAIEDGTARASMVVGLKLSKALGKPTTEIIELAPQMTGVLGGGIDPLLGPRVGPR
ncbi:MAG: helix-turn-helix transcriptional regulator [Thermomicrobiales bacterium]|nr:helix-turn-helix transcriptional regulator [Thermomicrobiales bacterium]MCO5220860.1 helix-turn-helix transcriptional regulator [Thermomicrobiales bacterium]